MQQTLPDTVLLAAATLPDEFHCNDLILACWHADPARFGLAGHNDRSADSNRVVVTLSGRRGLVHAGLLANVAPKRYTLTQLGRQRIRQLRGEDKAPSYESLRKERRAVVALPEPQKVWLSHLLATVAYEKWREGRRADINFAEACLFWQQRDADPACKAVAALADDLREKLSRCELDIGGGRLLTVAEVEAVAELSEWMRAKFAKHIKVLATRRVG